MASSTPTDSKLLFDATEVPLRSVDWSGLDHRLTCTIYSAKLHQFHRVEQMLHCYLWLNRWIPGKEPVLLVPNAMNLPAVQVYDVRHSVANGIRLGFMFRTPLQVVIEPEYLIACRRNMDAISSALEQIGSECKYRVGGLLIYSVEDLGVLVSKAITQDETSDYLET